MVPHRRTFWETILCFSHTRETNSVPLSMVVILKWGKKKPFVKSNLFFFLGLDQRLVPNLCYFFLLKLVIELKSSERAAKQCISSWLYRKEPQWSTLLTLQSSSNANTVNSGQRLDVRRPLFSFPNCWVHFSYTPSSLQATVKGCLKGVWLWQWGCFRAPGCGWWSPKNTSFVIFVVNKTVNQNPSWLKVGLKGKRKMVLV